MEVLPIPISSQAAGVPPSASEDGHPSGSFGLGGGWDERPNYEQCPHPTAHTRAPTCAEEAPSNASAEHVNGFGDADDDFWEQQQQRLRAERGRARHLASAAYAEGGLAAAIDIHSDSESGGGGADDGATSTAASEALLNNNKLRLSPSPTRRQHEGSQPAAHPQQPLHALPPPTKPHEQHPRHQPHPSHMDGHLRSTATNTTAIPDGGAAPRQYRRVPLQAPLSPPSPSPSSPHSPAVAAAATTYTHHSEALTVANANGGLFVLAEPTEPSLLAKAVEWGGRRAAAAAAPVARPLLAAGRRVREAAFGGRRRGGGDEDEGTASMSSADRRLAEMFAGGGSAFRRRQHEGSSGAAVAPAGVGGSSGGSTASSTVTMMGANGWVAATHQPQSLRFRSATPLVLLHSAVGEGAATDGHSNNASLDCVAATATNNNTCTINGHGLEQHSHSDHANNWNATAAEEALPLPTRRLSALRWPVAAGDLKRHKAAQRSATATIRFGFLVGLVAVLSLHQMAYERVRAPDSGERRGTLLSILLGRTAPKKGNNGGEHVSKGKTARGATSGGSAVHNAYIEERKAEGGSSTARSLLQQQQQQLPNGDEVSDVVNASNGDEYPQQAADALALEEALARDINAKLIAGDEIYQEAAARAMARAATAEEKKGPQEADEVGKTEKGSLLSLSSIAAAATAAAAFIFDHYECRVPSSYLALSSASPSPSEQQPPPPQFIGAAFCLDLSFLLTALFATLMYAFVVTRCYSAPLLPIDGGATDLRLIVDCAVAAGLPAHSGAPLACLAPSHTISAEGSGGITTTAAGYANAGIADHLKRGAAADGGVAFVPLALPAPLQQQQQQRPHVPLFVSAAEAAAEPARYDDFAPLHNSAKTAMPPTNEAPASPSATAPSAVTANNNNSSAVGTTGNGIRWELDDGGSDSDRSGSSNGSGGIASGGRGASASSRASMLIVADAYMFTSNNDKYASGGKGSSARRKRGSGNATPAMGCAAASNAATAAMGSTIPHQAASAASVVTPPLPPLTAANFPPGTFCVHCALPRPLRSKHCHDCGRCVLGMDHHCPWIGACVGPHNRLPFTVLTASMTVAFARGIAAFVSMMDLLNIIEWAALIVFGFIFILVSCVTLTQIVAVAKDANTYELMRNTLFVKLEEALRRQRQHSDELIEASLATDAEEDGGEENAVGGEKEVGGRGSARSSHSLSSSARKGGRNRRAVAGKGCRAGLRAFVADIAITAGRFVTFASEARWVLWPSSAPRSWVASQELRAAIVRLAAPNSGSKAAIAAHNNHQHQLSFNAHSSNTSISSIAPPTPHSMQQQCHRRVQYLYTMDGPLRTRMAAACGVPSGGGRSASSHGAFCSKWAQQRVVVAALRAAADDRRPMTDEMGTYLALALALRNSGAGSERGEEEKGVRGGREGVGVAGGATLVLPSAASGWMRVGGVSDGGQQHQQHASVAMPIPSAARAVYSPADAVVYAYGRKELEEGRRITAANQRVRCVST